MTSLIFSCLTSSWMGFWRRVGPGRAKLRHAGLSTSPVCSNSCSLNGLPQGAALTKVTLCRSLLHRLISVLVSTCTKYVSCPIKHVVLASKSCFFFSWDSAVLGNPVDDSCDPWACNSWRKNSYQSRPQRRRSACAGLCSEPALHTEKFILRFRLDNVVWVCCYRG